jgi:excinuclease ABC subunit A
MCPHCKGLGEIQEVDMARVIPDNTKSINEVAHRSAGRSAGKFHLQTIARHCQKYKFSFSTPVKEIPEEALHIMLYGGDETFDVSMTWGGDEWNYNLAAEGIVNMLKRWYTRQQQRKNPPMGRRFYDRGYLPRMQRGPPEKRKPLV